MPDEIKGIDKVFRDACDYLKIRDFDSSSGGDVVGRLDCKYWDDVPCKKDESSYQCGTITMFAKVRCEWP